VSLPGERVVDEALFELSLFGSPMGRLRVQDLELRNQGQQRQGARVTMNVAMKRLGQGIEIAMEELMTYDGSGQLAHFRTDLRMSSATQTTEGWVEGGQCRVVSRDGLTGTATERRIPWDPEAVSEPQMEEDFKNLIRGPVGGSVRHKLFVPDLLQTAATTATLMGVETRQTVFGPKALHKIQVTMDLGALVNSNCWVDGEGELYEQEIALGLFKMSAKRISGSASQPLAASAAPEVFEAAILKVSPPILRPEEARRAVYRLRFVPGSPPRIYEDEGQKSLGAQGQTLRLEVVSRAPDSPFPMSRVRAPEDGSAYLAASPLIQCGDKEIRRTALEAAGDETDAWKRAKRLEEWVHRYVREKSLGVGFASAKEVLQTREGDCTEHAALLVALCRAAGIPARAAEGLVYASSINGFGYHMWAEAYLDGWYDLDATRPGPMADATHIQLGASALENAIAGDLALQVLRSFGQFEIEVESIEPGQ